MRAVLFDFDGTLIDSIPDLHTALVHCFEPLDLPAPPPEQVRTMVGAGAGKLIERALRMAGAEVDAETEIALYASFLRHYRRTQAQGTRCFDGAVDLLEGLAAEGRKLALVTNKPIEPTHQLLELLSLQRFFPVVVGGDSLPTRKPDPAMLVHAAHELGVSCSDAWMVGDSNADVGGGERAGCGTIAVSWGYTPNVDALGADHVVHTMDELRAVIATA